MAVGLCESIAGHEFWITTSGVTGNALQRSNLRALETQAHVWLAGTDAALDAEQLAGYEALLSADERSRYRRFRFRNDRQSFLLAHALVRRALSRYADVRPQSWQFSAGAHGKPEISAPDLPARLRFNLSHTQGLAACLVVLEDDCGIDVELLSRRCDMQGIARRMFAPDELSALLQLEGEARRARFFELWTLREAYGKALGQGLVAAERGAGFGLRDDGTITLHDTGRSARPDDWQLSLLQPTRQHVLALAIRAGRHPRRRVVSRWLEPLTAPQNGAPPTD